MESAERTYRRIVSGTLATAYRVVVCETDLQIYSGAPLAEIARETVLALRGHLEGYIRRHADFIHTLTPWPLDDPSPPVVRAMIRAGRRAGVGPMAAVAGAIAQGVGEALLQHGPEVIVENGGDVFLQTASPVVIGLFAGASPLSLKVGLRLPGDNGPLAVCTSSGTLGHSRSFGRADAACILCPDAALADAAATAVGNRVQNPSDIASALEAARRIEGVSGAVVICGERIGAWGAVELVPLHLRAPSGDRSAAGGKRG
ncbi:MAG: UPF0280 family protein [Desulfobacterales bacterium]|jgi:hypothetical protein|nr:UPF0280 family protein [Desulfobacteraceae bacterium]MDD3991127.1 UPF0280 family protein [Desulfobacteraceae bacterium]MDY0312296.1 UPF0280 family protein [Desulfobacterales bacterium]